MKVKGETPNGREGPQINDSKCDGRDKELFTALQENYDKNKAPKERWIWWNTQV